MCVCVCVCVGRESAYIALAFNFSCYWEVHVIDNIYNHCFLMFCYSDRIIRLSA